MSMGTPGNHDLADIQVDTVLLDEMIAHLIRRERVFQAGRHRIESRHFNGLGEGAYRMIWGATLVYHEQYGRLPPKEVLAAEVIPRIHANPAAAPETDKAAADIIDWIWASHTSDEDFEDAAALNYIQIFLLEREVNQELREAVQNANGRAIPGLPQLLSDLSDRHRQIETLGQNLSHAVVPDRWETSSRTLFPTGVAMFDERMNGGSESGDVNVMLGPTGVGKTMAAMQLLNSTARLSAANVAAGLEGHINVFVSYEDNLRSMQIRSMCNAAQIDKTRLERITSYRELSTRGNLQTYETQRFAHLRDSEGEIPGEMERLEMANVWLRRHVRLLDFSGSREFGPASGDGGIGEIRMAIDQVVQESGLPLGLVVIDWAGDACSRWLYAQGKDADRNLPIELKDYVKRVHGLITAPFGARAWVLHQLKGSVNSRPPTTIPHHSEAEWCASFAVNAWFAFVLGTKDHNSNACMMACTKTRRGPGTTPIVCRIDGAFGQLVQADHEFRPDPASRRILSRTEADAVQRTAPTHSAPRQSSFNHSGVDAEGDFDETGGMARGRL